MKVQEITAREFLQSVGTQFIIPVYQRAYVWGEKNCKTLIDDIERIAQTQIVHFIGGIVFLQNTDHLTNVLKKRDIIDGQQRLTTITLMYLALYKHFEKSEETKRTARQILELYLINPHDSQSNKFKLQGAEEQTQRLLNTIKDADDIDKLALDSSNKFCQNFKLFYQALKKNPKRADIWEKGLRYLIVVEMSLEYGRDDPQRIFESLNSTGLDLSQADLVRNHILVGLNRDAQKRLYNDYWSAIESCTKTKDKVFTSNFLKDYLLLKTHNFIIEREIYQNFKKEYPHLDLSELENLLKSLFAHAKAYQWIISPKQAPVSLRTILEDLQELNFVVMHPILMYLLCRYDNNDLELDDLLDTLYILRNYCMRRYILSLRSNTHRGTFLNLYKELLSKDRVNLAQFTTHFLRHQNSDRRMPSDDEIKHILPTKDAYNLKYIKYILARLENHNNKEPVDFSKADITIEHIFPQNPDAIWKQALDPQEYSAFKDIYLHTLGNLTLSGNNQQLGNKSFTDKKHYPQNGYLSSRLWLNHALSEFDEWNQKSYEARSTQMIQRFLEVWPSLGVEPLDNAAKAQFSDKGRFVPLRQLSKSMTGKTIAKARVFGEVLEAPTMADVYRHTLTHLMRNLQQKTRATLFELNIAHHTPQGMRQKHELVPGVFIEMHGNNNKRARNLLRVLDYLDASDKVELMLDQYAD